MKIMRFELPESRGQARVGLVDVAANQVLDAAAVLAHLGVAINLVRPRGWLSADLGALDIIAYNTENRGSLASSVKDLSAFDVQRWPADGVISLPAVEAGSLRDFIAFEQHITTTRRNRGLEVPPAWYELPAYYKGNYRSLMGHEQPMNWPRFTEKLDFELELACVVGREGRDLSEADAEGCIGGYSVMNDWSARDIQMQEGSVGLGPAKGKDFGTSVGPWVVTPEEFNPRDARMTAKINGEMWSDGNIGTIHWSFPKMISHVSMDETVYPGDLMGSGTVGGGCGFELDRWLQPGDVVELEVEGIGVLRNRVVRDNR